MHETKILDLPFLFCYKTDVCAVLDGSIGRDLPIKFDAKGFKLLAWAENDVRHVTNGRRDVKVLEDFRGLKVLKMRTTENSVHIAAYKGLGTVPTPMALAKGLHRIAAGHIRRPRKSAVRQRICQIRPIAKAFFADRPRVPARCLRDERGSV